MVFMGISNQFHFDWLNEAIDPVRERIRESLPKRPQVLGIGEHSPNVVLQQLLNGFDSSYQACDRFPKSALAKPCDMNDLSPFFGKLRVNLVCMFRCSYFIEDKFKFLKQLKAILLPGSFVLMDFLIGSSDLPVLDFRYGNSKASDGKGRAYFSTSFYDDRLVREFPLEVMAFCRHARSWPIGTQIRYLREHPSFYWKDRAELRDISTETLGEHLKRILPEQNLFSLSDFEESGLEIVMFKARYFYPYVKKFNLYNFVLAKSR